MVLSNTQKVFAFIPGISHTLRKFSHILVRGGRVKDIPGMKYVVVRGKFDLRGLVSRRQKRSKYGTTRLMAGLR